MGAFRGLRVLAQWLKLSLPIPLAETRHWPVSGGSQWNLPERTGDEPDCRASKERWTLTLGPFSGRMVFREHHSLHSRALMAIASLRFMEEMYPES